MIDFTGSKDRDFFKHFQFPRNRQVRQTLSLYGLSDFVHLKSWLVGGSNKYFALVSIGTSNDSDLAILAVIWKGSSQGILHGG